MPSPFVDLNQATLFGDRSRPRDRAPRVADELFDALMHVTKTNAASLTASGRGMANRHLKELRNAGATPAEVLRRSQVYVERFRSTPTSGALTRHWASLESSPLAARKTSQERVEPLSPERRAEIAARMRQYLDER